jgi:outer membrane protein assembly factor BamD (BamD/ComL family)
VSDARLQLQEIVARYPELAAEENLPSVIERIDNTFARKLAVTADFYRRTNEPRAAANTYEYLRQHYPNSAEAQRAPAAVMGEPVPTTVPSTGPSSP